MDQVQGAPLDSSRSASATEAKQPHCRRFPPSSSSQYSEDREESIEGESVEGQSDFGSEDEGNEVERDASRGWETMEVVSETAAVQERHWTAGRDKARREDEGKGEGAEEPLKTKKGKEMKTEVMQEGDMAVKNDATETSVSEREEEDSGSVISRETADRALLMGEERGETLVGATSEEGDDQSEAEASNTEHHDPLAYIRSLGPLSATCRPSLLQPLISRGELLLSSTLRPALAPSGLHFDDLAVNPNNHQLQEVVLPAFQLSLLRAVQVPGTGVQRPVAVRTARMCLYDGTSFVGNAHTISAKRPRNDREPWIFPSQANNGGCIVRSHTKNEGLFLYIELNVSYEVGAEESSKRERDDASGAEGQVDEITCAWAVVQFPETAKLTGSIAHDREFVVDLYGGTMGAPIDLHPKAPGGEKTTVWKMLASKRKRGLMRVRFSRLSAPDQENARLLPRTVIVARRDVAFVVMFRHVLAAKLLGGGGQDVRRSAFSPILSLYPKIVDDDGLHAAFLQLWDKQTSSWTSADEKDGGLHLLTFQRCVLRLWPPLFTRHLPPPPRPNNTLATRAREVVLQKFVDLPPEEHLTKATHHWLHKPFDSRELAYDPTFLP